MNIDKYDYIITSNSKMVKNAGGNKSKGQARKFVTAPKSTVLRISEDPCEVYAQVTKTLGHGMCHVVSIDGTTLLCHIRGKFRGRGKKDNIINNGCWILVGLREWESEKSKDDKKLNNCDLLEVYNNSDKEKLKKIVNTLNWSLFVKNDNLFGNNNADETEDNIGFKFMDEETEDYEKIVEAQLASKKSSTVVIDDEEINIDDI